MTYSAEVRRAVGAHLAARGKLRRGELALWARHLGVEERTLRKWRSQAGVLPARGRPPHARESWRAALRPVARAWKDQGRSSGLPRVRAALRRLGLWLPITIVRALLRELKARSRAVLARRRAQERRHTEVQARDVFWSQDATHLGRDGVGEIQALAVKDVATTTLIEGSLGGPARGADVLALLASAKLVRGTLPLVLGMDNGPANRHELVLSWLRNERVIVLWNVPHTPQHNAPIESLFGELKLELEATGGLAARGADPSQGHVSLSEPGVPATRMRLRERLRGLARRLNERVRPSRGARTAAELDRILPRAEDLVDRARFYAAACAAIQAAVQGNDNPRARRRAEREAILCTLERFGLVTRTRGRRPVAALQAVRLS
jgi:hypothetical protein